MIQCFKDLSNKNISDGQKSVFLSQKEWDTETGWRKWQAKDILSLKCLLENCPYSICYLQCTLMLHVSAGCYLSSLATLILAFKKFSVCDYIIEC